MTTMTNILFLVIRIAVNLHRYQGNTADNRQMYCKSVNCFYSDPFWIIS